MPCSSSTVRAGTDQQNWKCRTTSPCSNSHPIRRNSTRWKTFGPTCAPTSWQSLCLNPTMRSSTNAAMPGISSQRTNRQSHQLHHVIGPKQSINRAVGITRLVVSCTVSFVGTTILVFCTVSFAGMTAGLGFYSLPVRGQASQNDEYWILYSISGRA